MMWFVSFGFVAGRSRNTRSAQRRVQLGLPRNDVSGLGHGAAPFANLVPRRIS